MSIKVQCDGCAKRFSAADKLAGKRVKCPSCGAAIEIPILLLDEVAEDSLDDLLVGTPTNTEPTLVPSSKSPASSTPQPDPLAPLGDPLADLLGGDLAAGPVVVDGGSTVAAEAKRPKPVRVSAGTSRPLRFARNHMLFTLVVACVVLRLIISACFAQFTAGVVGACVGGLIAFFVLRPRLVNTDVTYWIWGWTRDSTRIGAGKTTFFVVLVMGVLSSFGLAKMLGPSPKLRVFLWGVALVNALICSVTIFLIKRYGFSRAAALGYIALSIWGVAMLPFWIGNYPDLAWRAPRGGSTLFGSVGDGGDSIEPYPFASIPCPDFPQRGSFRPLQPGIERSTVNLPVPSGQPGNQAKLWVYLPSGHWGSRSLACVLIAPAGAYSFSGMALGSGDQAEHMPYVKAGFAVVAYEIDGEMQGQSLRAARRAYEGFGAARAGLVNARNALEWVLAKLPEVDPGRIYAAGHSSAATLAILFAEHEPRIKACVAYAPVCNMPRRVAKDSDDLEAILPDCDKFFQHFSPHTHAARLNCPLFLFHAHDDSNVPVEESQEFANQLRQLGKEVTLELVARGDHYDSMVAQGIPRAIRWLNKRQRPSPSAVASTQLPAPRMPAPKLDPDSHRTPGIPRPGPGPEPPIVNRKPTEEQLPRIWEFRPDPLPEKLTFPAEQKIAIPIKGSSSPLNVLFPSTPSRFVALGGNSGDDEFREVWNLETLQSAGKIAGQLDAHQPWMLSPDGRHLAAEFEEADGNINVWSFETGQLAGTVNVGRDGHALQFDFGGPDQLVTGTEHFEAAKVRIWDIKTGKPLREFEVPRGKGTRAPLTFTPGRKYLAKIDEYLQIYQLATGKLVGRVPVPRGGQSLMPACQAASFSPECTELVAVVWTGPTWKLLCWDLKQGQVTVDREMDGQETSRAVNAGMIGGGPALQWLPNGLGWLLSGSRVVDRKTGQIVWGFSKEPGELPQRLLDDKRLLVTSAAFRAARGRETVLTTIDVPYEEIQAAAMAVQAGGKAIDAKLPPLTVADQTPARKVSLPPDDVDWSLSSGTAAAASQPPYTEPIVLGKDNFLQAAFSHAAAGRAVVLLSENKGLVPRWKSEDCAHWLQHMDLFSGKLLGRVDVPGRCSLLALSPDGSLAAVRATENRIDVFSMVEGKHLYGWRLDQQVVWAGFVDQDHVATLSGNNGVLQCWQVPACRALYVTMTGAAVPAFFSPGRKHLVVYSKSRYRFLNPLTGEVQGDLSFPADCGPCGNVVSSRGGWSPEWVSRLSSQNPSQSQAGFSADGGHLAAIAGGPPGSVVLCWDLADGRLTSEFHVPRVDQNATLQWCGPRQLLLTTRPHELAVRAPSTAYLVDLDCKAAVWKYRLTNSRPVHPSAGNAPCPIAWADDRQRVWLVAETGFMEKNRYLVACGVPIDAAMTEVEATAPKDPAPVLASGSTVRLDVNGVTATGFPADLRSTAESHLRTALAANGVQIDTRSPVRLVASCQRGEPIKKTFERTDMRGFLEDPFDVTFYPISVLVELSDGGNRTLWARGTQLYPKDFHETVQVPDTSNKVAYLQKMSSDVQLENARKFFTAVRLPRILYPQPNTAPDGKPGLGETVLDPNRLFNVKPPELATRPSPDKLPGGLRSGNRLPPGFELPPGFKRPPGFELPPGFPPRQPRIPRGSRLEGEAYEKASRDYTRQAHVDLIAGEGAAIAERLRWFPGARRPAIGLRWGLGVQLVGRKDVPNIRTMRDLAKLTGPAGPAVGTEIQQRITEGKFGDWPQPQDPRFRQVDLLGAGKQADLIAAAGRRGLDALVVASLTARAIGLTGRTETLMTMRLVEVAGKKVLWSSKSLSSTRVAAAKRTGADPAADLVKEVIAQVDDLFALGPMPTLKPAVVKHRVEGLVASVSQSASPDELLPVLAEVRYYQSKQLLTAEEAIPLFDQILGAGKGSVLATGDAAQQRSVLEQWLKQ